MLLIPEGWSVEYEDPTINSDRWEQKEDLLQLRHAALDRLVDLGWYGHEFAILVFQGDFQGDQLDNIRVHTQAEALEKLRDILRVWGANALP